MRNNNYKDSIMKRFKTLLDENVHKRYKRAHGKNATGSGLWIFTTQEFGMPDERDTFDFSGSFNDAKKAAEKHFKTKNVYVMEAIQYEAADSHIISFDFSEILKMDGNKEMVAMMRKMDGDTRAAASSCSATYNLIQKPKRSNGWTWKAQVAGCPKDKLEKELMKKDRNFKHATIK
jgi:hypothetical protein